MGDTRTVDVHIKRLRDKFEGDHTWSIKTVWGRSRLQIRKVGRLFTFPSLFSRLVCVYISILVIVLIVLFITFTHSFQSYFVKYTQEIMINQAKSIADEYDKAGRDGNSRSMVLIRFFLIFRL